MDVTLAVLLTVLLGIAVGGGFMLLLQRAAAQRSRVVAALERRLPAGIEQLLEAMGSPAIIADASHNITLVTTGIANLGVTRRGERLDERLGGLVDSCRRQNTPIDADIDVPRGPFGSAELHLHVRVARITARYFLVLVEDRTEAIRVERVRRDFVANVSHELKTPISAITLLAEAIESAADDEEQVRYFTGRLDAEALRLKRLTNELIDLSRLQSTDSLDGATIVDTAEIIGLAIDQTRVTAEAKRIRISVSAPPGLLVFGEAGLLLMALQNLVANAINYSAEGSPVGVGARIHEGAVEVSVTDQGIGITPEEQGRIFERFYRVDPARSRRTGGSGLGLSIVRHIVENHGGDIRVWSRVGKGSTFTIRLPLIDSDATLDDDEAFDTTGEVTSFDERRGIEADATMGDIPAATDASTATDAPTATDASTATRGDTEIDGASPTGVASPSDGATPTRKRRKGYPTPTGRERRKG